MEAHTFGVRIAGERGVERLGNVHVELARSDLVGNSRMYAPPGRWIALFDYPGCAEAATLGYGLELRLRKNTKIQTLTS